MLRHVAPARAFEKLDLVAGLADEVRGGAVRVLDELQAVLRAEHADRSRERIGSHAVRRDDRDEAVIREPEAGARIDDVRVALAGDFHALENIAARGDAAVFQIHDLRRRRVRRIERRDLDPPAGLVWRRIARRHVAAAADEGAGKTARFQNGERFVAREAFRNRAEIEPHVRREQFRSAQLGIEPQLFVARARAHLREQRRVRQRLRTPRATPHIHQRPDRDVERPAAPLRHRLRVRQHLPQRRAHRHRHACRARQPA